MAQDEKSRPVGDWPTITENQWYTFALVSVILTAVAILGGFIWIFADGFDGQNDVLKAQSLAPFGVALFALVTFCTVSWRGAITTRQANQSEREGRAKLLQEGAKLLGEKENPSHIGAGIATLEIVITGDDPRLAEQAMSLIADYIQSKGNPDTRDQTQSAAFEALKAGETMGRQAQRSLVFKAPDGEEPDWDLVPGTWHTRYIGGSFSWLDPDKLSDPELHAFVLCKIFAARASINTRKFFECEFVYSKIGVVDEKSSLNNNTFKDCDFSNCIFNNVEDLLSIATKDCYFYKGLEPKIISNPQFKNWEDHFQIRDRADERTLKQEITYRSKLVESSPR